jgi:hypothetical protein
MFLFPRCADLIEVFLCNPRCRRETRRTQSRLFANASLGSSKNFASPVEC